MRRRRRRRGLRGSRDRRSARSSGSDVGGCRDGARCRRGRRGAAAAVAAARGGGGGGGGGGGPTETGGGAWGRRGMSQGKYYGLKQGDAGAGETVQGEDDKFFDPDYEYLMVVGGSSNKQLANEIAEEMGLKCGAVTLGRYADGEVMVQLDEHVRGKDVYIVQSGQKPVNDNLIELLLMVSTMQRASAKRVTAVIPLSVPAADVGRLLEVMGVDRVIAVDLERPGTGSGGAFLGPGIPVETLLTTNIFPSSGLVKKAIQFKRKLREYVDDVRVQTFLHARPNSGPVDVSSNELMGNIGEVKGRDVVIVDELIDTGGTLGALPRRLKKAGAMNIYVCSSHGLFNANAVAILEESPVDTVFVTNSVPLPEGCKSKKIEQLHIGRYLARMIFAEHVRSADLFKEDDIVFE
ncbi:conserved unknown protein [Ectocarpus siliculosus]|uniref:ribose-phosphate diphosphokinase n=1 Tax=Ectocarpus siliculosus TaxID=2880 RepID=D7FX99_ECTSI|nr:conserved unknown protein [Ectocarpus siliculosus]|eukprot:CBJ49277.1 conserved unknown protein [Ectocarpus siliculosus]